MKENSDRKSALAEDFFWQGRKGDDALAAFLGALDVHLPYYTGAVFRGFTIKHQGEGYLLVLRGTLKGQAKVAFFGSTELMDVYRKLFGFVVKWGVDWKDDRYA